MLSGVSAGVIGLNEEGHIQLFNQSAEEFLELNIGDMIGTSIGSAVPAMAGSSGPAEYHLTERTGKFAMPVKRKKRYWSRSQQKSSTKKLSDLSSLLMMSLNFSQLKKAAWATWRGGSPMRSKIH